MPGLTSPFILLFVSETNKHTNLTACWIQTSQGLFFFFFLASIFLLSCWLGKNSVNNGVINPDVSSWMFKVWEVEPSVNNTSRIPNSSGRRGQSPGRSSVPMGEILLKSYFSAPPLYCPSFLKKKIWMLWLLVFLALSCQDNKLCVPSIVFFFFFFWCSWRGSLKKQSQFLFSRCWEENDFFF